jgi:hypothetical protein
MKHFSKLVLKGLFVAIFFTAGSITISTLGVNTINEANAVENVTVNSYLTTSGYTVVTLEPKAGTEYDWIAHTVKNGVHYWTTIYCDANGIIGNSDVPMFR